MNLRPGRMPPAYWVTDPDSRPDRCRACYRLRLEEAAAYAAANGFEGLATTLTVSPYQYIETIHEELEAACRKAGTLSGLPGFSRAVSRGDAQKQGAGHVPSELLRLCVFQSGGRRRARAAQGGTCCSEGEARRGAALPSVRRSRPRRVPRARPRRKLITRSNYASMRDLAENERAES